MFNHNKILSNCSTLKLAAFISPVAQWLWQIGYVTRKSNKLKISKKRHAPGIVTRLLQIPTIAQSKRHIEYLLLTQHPLEQVQEPTQLQLLGSQLRFIFAHSIRHLPTNYRLHLISNLKVGIAIQTKDQGMIGYWRATNVQKESKVSTKMDALEWPHLMLGEFQPEYPAVMSRMMMMMMEHYILRSTSSNR